MAGCPDSIFPLVYPDQFPDSIFCLLARIHLPGYKHRYYPPASQGSQFDSSLSRARGAGATGREPGSIHRFRVRAFTHPPSKNIEDPYNVRCLAKSKVCVFLLFLSYAVCYNSERPATHPPRVSYHGQYLPISLQISADIGPISGRYRPISADIRRYPPISADVGPISGRYRPISVRYRPISSDIGRYRPTNCAIPALPPLPPFSLSKKEL